MHCESSFFPFPLSMYAILIIDSVTVKVRPISLNLQYRGEQFECLKWQIWAFVTLPSAAERWCSHYISRLKVGWCKNHVWFSGKRKFSIFYPGVTAFYREWTLGISSGGVVQSGQKTRWEAKCSDSSKGPVNICTSADVSFISTSTPKSTVMSARQHVRSPQRTQEASCITYCRSAVGESGGPSGAPTVWGLDACCHQPCGKALNMQSRLA